MTNRSTFVCLSLLLHLAVCGAAQGTPSTNSSTTTVQPERIDTHTHYVPPFYKALLEARNISAGGLPIPSWNASAHLSVNAQFGIRTSIVSVSTPGAKLSQDAPVDEGRTLARQLNEFGFNLTKQYPQDFLFFATLTLPDLDGAVAEAAYALDTLGAAGVIVEASVYGELLGTPRYAPLYQLLDDRKATVFIHPSNSPCAVDADSDNSTELKPYVIDFLLDTSRAALNLVYFNVTTGYPNIKWILAHSGGFLPFAATRGSDGLTLVGDRRGNHSVYYAELQNFLVDLAISANPTALPSTTAFFKSTHLTFGSDFPYIPSIGISQNTDGLMNFPIANEDKRRINFGNAHRIFKKFLTY